MSIKTDTSTTALVHKKDEDMLHRLKIQSIILFEIHRYMAEKGMIQLMPVILSKFTDPLGPDPGSSVVKTGEIEYQGQKLQLTQSMILHKQMAIGKGLEKFYIMSPNVRLESAHRKDSGVHAFEFTQVDFEFAGETSEFVFTFTEDLMRRIRDAVVELAGDELRKLDRKLTQWEDKFPRYTSHELIDKYGEDWERLSSLEEKTPYWVICHKREFYDKLDRSKEGEHYLNYDLYYPEGFAEGLSGAERESEYEFIKSRLEADELFDHYPDFIELAKEGKIYPSAGAGIGIERLVRYFTGAPHISDVQLFKRIPGELVTF